MPVRMVCIHHGENFFTIVWPDAVSSSPESVKIIPKNVLDLAVEHVIEKVTCLATAEKISYWKAHWKENAGKKENTRDNLNEKSVGLK